MNTPRRPLRKPAGGRLSQTVCLCGSQRSRTAVLSQAKGARTRAAVSFAGRLAPASEFSRDTFAATFIVTNVTASPYSKYQPAGANLRPTPARGQAWSRVPKYKQLGVCWAGIE